MAPARADKISSDLLEWIRSKRDEATEWHLASFPKGPDGMPRKAAILWAKLTPPEGQWSPEQIAAHLVGGAEGAYRALGNTATDQFQATAKGESGKESKRFRIPTPNADTAEDDDIAKGAGAISENPWLAVIEELRRENRRLGMELADTRTRLDFAREGVENRMREMMAELLGEGFKNTNKLREYYEEKVEKEREWARSFVRDMIEKERDWALERIKDERSQAIGRVEWLEKRCDELVERISDYGKRAMEPTQEMMGTVLGLLAAASEMNAKTMDVTIIREEMAAESARDDRRWTAFERTISSMGDIGGSIIEAKYGAKGKEIAKKVRQIFKDPAATAAATGSTAEMPASSDSKEAKPVTSPHPNYSKLTEARDEFFKRVTDLDVEVLKLHAGQALADRILALKNQNPIDLVELGGVIGSISSLPQASAFKIFKEMSTPAAEKLMEIGSIVDELADAIEAETKKKEN